ncbi:MAG: response regulator [Chitinophagaceae bacterium]
MQLIVYVDDDEDDFFLFKKAISEISDNYSVLRIDNPGNLFELIKVIKPDFIFLDINMPLMNGVECLKNIRAVEEYDGIPVIIYSTVTDFKEVSYRNKANYYLVKPDSFVKILTTLSSILSYNWREDFYPARDKPNNLLV